MKRLILASMFVGLSSAAFAAEPLTDEQMDQVTAGFEVAVQITVKVNGVSLEPINIKRDVDGDGPNFEDPVGVVLQVPPLRE